MIIDFVYKQTIYKLICDQLIIRLHAKYILYSYILKQYLFNLGKLARDYILVKIYYLFS